MSGSDVDAYPVGTSYFESQKTWRHLKFKIRRIQHKTISRHNLVLLNDRNRIANLLAYEIMVMVHINNRQGTF